MPAGTAGTQLAHTSSRPSTFPGSPTWASVVTGEAREGLLTCPGSQPAIMIVADLLALYQRCVHSCLKASVNISHGAGCQVFTIACNIPAPAVTDNAARRRRQSRRRRRGRATTAACEEPASSLPSAAVAAVAAADLPPPALSTPPPAPPTPPSPDMLTPPAKKTRRCQNKLELLRDHEEEDKLTLSPLSLSAPATPPSATLHATTPPSTPATSSPSLSLHRRRSGRGYRFSRPCPHHPRYRIRQSTWRQLQPVPHRLCHY
jgi:hypothetical protein